MHRPADVAAAEIINIINPKVDRAYWKKTYVLSHWTSFCGSKLKWIQSGTLVFADIPLEKKQSWPLIWLNTIAASPQWCSWETAELYWTHQRLPRVGFPLVFLEARIVKRKVLVLAMGARCCNYKTTRSKHTWIILLLPLYTTLPVH